MTIALNRTWHCIQTSFAESTDHELIIENERASLEIAYFPKKNAFGYSLLVTDKDGDLLLDELSEHITFKTVNALLKAIQKDTQIKKYMGEVELPSLILIRKLVK